VEEDREQFDDGEGHKNGDRAGRNEQTPPNPNWNVAFTVDGNVMAPELAYRVARALQSHFELD
jgi:hypothetical protein